MGDSEDTSLLNKRGRSDGESNRTQLKRQKTEDETTCALHISNLRRPFSIPELKSLLEQSGELTHFWLSPNRAHCLLVVPKEDTATEIKQRLHDEVWPEGGQKLRVQYCSKDFALNNTNEFYLTEAGKSRRVDKKLDDLFRFTETTPKIYWCMNNRNRGRDIEIIREELEKR